MAKAKQDSIPDEKEYDKVFEGSTADVSKGWADANRGFMKPVPKKKKKKKKSWIRNRVDNYKAVDKYFGEHWKSEDLKKRVKKMKAKGAALRARKKKKA